MKLRRRTGALGLDDRLLALQDALAAGEGVIDGEPAARARALVDRAGERLGHGVEHTVVALAGATGSGKSSLFNALVGEQVSTVGVRRPTTSRTSAAAWGSGADGLLAWLEVPSRHAVAVGAGDPLEGLVLLDLPDHDSTALAHRAEVDRVVGVADVVVWVLDPQKYADAAVHDGYLRPLAHRAPVLLVVLNQVDRLDEASLAACRADLRRLLADDGLRDVEALATSAATGAGIAELRAELGRRVSARGAAVERLSVDVADVAATLGEGCGDTGGAPAADHRRRIVGALGEAAGVPTVTSAVARSHAGHGARRVGWPFTRWLGRLRPDPLRRLHLQPGAGSAARTSLPPPSDVAVARLGTAARDLADDTARHLPPEWAGAVRDHALAAVRDLPVRLDAAVAGTDLGADDRPRWWTVVQALQSVLAVVAVAGAGWLAILAGLGYLQLGDVGTPDVGEIPLPTAMLLGGVLLGLLVAAVAGPFVGIGARRRARRAERRLLDRVAAVADEALLAPVDALVGRHRAFCEAVGRAAGDTPARGKGQP